MGILETKANILASKSKNISKKSFSADMFENSQNKIYSHLSFIDNNSLPILCIGAPIYSDNIFVGIVIFKIKVDYLFDILQQRSELGESGEALVGTYNDKDLILFSPLRFSTSQLVIPPSEPNKAIPMRTAFKYKIDRLVANALDYRNVKVFSSVYYYKPLNLGLVVKKDSSEIMAPINKLKNNLLIISILGLLASILISYLLARYMTTKIALIVNTTSRISKGELHNRIAVVSNDELAHLARSVNSMADILVDTNAYLEKKVHEKTAYLEEAKSQLENIFNITPNITLLTNGKTLIKANDRFYTFTEYPDLEAFLQDYDCICDMFEIENGYLRPKIEGLTWVEYICQYKEKTHRAIIKKNNIEYLFLVNAAQYTASDGNRYYIVVFENITELQEVAFTDQLTKLINRMRIDEMLDRCSNSYKRYSTVFSILLIDIDHFKHVNDTYGHLVGDEILKSIARILDENTRNIDLVGRWGGEEFLVISKEINIHGAKKLAEKLRQSVETYQFETTKNQTISIGVAEVQENETIDELLTRADNALYEAKANGRNRVVISYEVL